MSAERGSEIPTEKALIHRGRLLGLAYRMLGDMDAAEDVVQEAYLRWHRADRSAVRSAEGWLVTVVSRLAVDQLRRATAERATYPGPWLPQPVAVEAPHAPSSTRSPDYDAELGSDLSIAFLLLLERLAPEERAAFLLRDVFDEEYAQIARILERTQASVRQLVHRARTRVRADRAPVAPAEEHERLFGQLGAALAADDPAAMMAILAPDVTLGSDGGGKVHAARRWLVGPDHVSRFLLGIVRKSGSELTYRAARLNGLPASLTLRNGEIVGATILDVREGRIHAIHMMVNPDKLRRLVEVYRIL